jgi:O-antigen/teichoic acid export membrane protein
VAKLIGAFYRIPLTNLIGGEGIGLYQLVYPLYCILLTVSATGIPSSIATLTARERAENKSALPLFKTCMKLFLAVGAVSTALMLALAPMLSSLQGERRLVGGYFALAPSVLIVSAISVFRGYFQGQNQMTPTAVSEVIEQAVKVGVGLLTAYLFRSDVYRAVTALLFSVTVSECVALVYLIIRFRRTPAPCIYLFCHCFRNRFRRLLAQLFQEPHLFRFQLFVRPIRIPFAVFPRQEHLHRFQIRRHVLFCLFSFDELQSPVRFGVFLRHLGKLISERDF